MSSLSPLPLLISYFLHLGSEFQLQHKVRFPDCPSSSQNSVGWPLASHSFTRKKTAAAAKSLQSFLTLCDPIDSSPPGSPVPGIFPGKNTGVGCHFLLQCMKVKSESEVAQSCPTLSDPMDCSLPGSSIHGIFQARVLEWGAIAFSRKKTRWAHFLGTAQFEITGKTSDPLTLIPCHCASMQQLKCFWRPGIRADSAKVEFSGSMPECVTSWRDAEEPASRKGRNQAILQI